MKSKSLSLILNYAIYVLTILLVFFVVFEKYLELPRLIGWLGRWHPLLLHFPIVLIFIAVIQYWRKDKAAHWYQTAATLFTLLSALTGFILSMEGDAKGNLILTHQWLGISVAMIMVMWYFLSSYIKPKPTRILHGLIIILIVLAGHFGGMLTHGEEFLAFNQATGIAVTLPENPNIYEHLVQPVFDARCVSCHNENKAKGKLILTHYSALEKGGESGAMTNPDSELLRRLLLSTDHEEHMPPAKEKQLTNNELLIVKSWFEHGADPQLTYADLDPKSELAGIAKKMIDSGSTDNWSALPAISDAEMEKLSSEYCTIRRMYQKAHALQVLVFPQNPSDPGVIQNLKKISKNIVELSLSGLLLSQNDIKAIGDFKNLEVLNIRDCSFSEDDFNTLKSLNNLKILKASNIPIGDKVISEIQNFNRLTNLYVYNTKISESGLDRLKSQMPNLQIVTHVVEADDFKANLPPPVLKPVRYFFCEPFHIVPEHPLPGVDIKYSTGISHTDAHILLMHDSILIDKNTNLKYFASKEGWESSTVDSIRFFRSCIKPEDISLINPPDEKYKGDGKHILFDLEKGTLNFGDGAWMGFREKDFVLHCDFGKAVSITGLTLSSIVNTDPYLFPPGRIRVYGGIRADELSLLTTEKPSVPTERIESHFEFYQCEIPASSVRLIRIVVEPLQSIPVWHQAKGERAWFFIDEIVFVSADDI